MNEINFTPYIPTTVLGLIGLLFGYLYGIYRNRNKTKLSQLTSVDSKDRPRIIEMMINDLGVQIDTRGLNAQQKYDLVIQLLTTKTRKYLIISITSILLSAIIALVIWSSQGGINRKEITGAIDSINKKKPDTTKHETEKDEERKKQEERKRNEKPKPKLKPIYKVELQENDEFGNPYYEKFDVTSTPCDHCGGIQWSKEFTLTKHPNGKIKCVKYRCTSGPCPWSYNPDNNNHSILCAGEDSRDSYRINYSFTDDELRNSFVARRKWDSGTVTESYIAYYAVPVKVCVENCD